MSPLRIFVLTLLAMLAFAGNSLLCVAALTPDKGHDVLLDGLAMVTDLSWRCECVGSLARAPAFSDGVRRATQIKGLGDRVRFPGPLFGPELDRALKRLDTLGERMDTVTASLQRSSESVETVAARAAKGEGSLGKLMTDDELYRDLNQTVNNLNEATLSLNRLLDDIQKNPKKYINLKVF